MDIKIFLPHYGPDPSEVTIKFQYKLTKSSATINIIFGLDTFAFTSSKNLTIKSTKI